LNLKIKKEKLIKEEKNTKKNLYKINNQWRAIMRDIKSKDLLKDIEIMSQTFERIIDRKDSVIKALVIDLQEDEEQYAMAMRSHFENVDQLTKLQWKRLESMRKKCEDEIETIKIEFDKERDYILKRHSEEMNELITIIYGMEKTFLDQETDAQNEFQSTKDELKNKNLEDKQQLRLNLETKVQDLWSQFQKAMKNYEETTEDRKRQFYELKEKDEKSAKEIDMQMRKIQALTDDISNQKAKISLNTKKTQEANNLIKAVTLFFTIFSRNLFNF
jgi:dynein regulatory complex subunit 2